MLTDKEFEVLEQIAYGVNRLAQHVFVGGTGPDASGGTVGSLGEAVMGVTAGLVQVADALSDIADAIREHTEQMVLKP